MNEHISAGINSGEAGTTLDIPVGEWTHVVAVFVASPPTNDTEILLYLNGEIVQAQFPSEFQMANSGEPLIIGAHDVNSFANYFNGAIDELAIYKRTLGEAEVTAHYEAIFEEAGEPYVPVGGGDGFVRQAGGARAFLTFPHVLFLSAPRLLRMERTPGDAQHPQERILRSAASGAHS